MQTSENPRYSSTIYLLFVRKQRQPVLYKILWAGLMWKTLFLAHGLTLCHLVSRQVGCFSLMCSFQFVVFSDPAVQFVYKCAISSVWICTLISSLSSFIFWYELVPAAPVTASVLPVAVAMPAAVKHISDWIYFVSSSVNSDFLTWFSLLSFCYSLLVFLYVNCKHCETLFKINSSVTEQHCLVSLPPSHKYLTLSGSSVKLREFLPAELSVLCLVVSVWSLSRVHPSGWSEAVLQETFALSCRLLPSHYWISSHQRADSVTEVLCREDIIFWLWQYR